MRTKINGFTLLEVLIALFIFTFVSLILTKGLHTVISTQASTEKNAEQLRQLQLALLLFSRDLEQTLDGPAGTGEGREETAFLGTPSTLRFTHLGFSNPKARLQSSALQRSAYRFDQGQFIRDSWSMLDQNSRPSVHSRCLLSSLKQISFRYLDKNKVFHSFWPPEAANEEKEKLPQAVLVKLSLEQGGELQQLYLLPQQEVLHGSH